LALSKTTAKEVTNWQDPIINLINVKRSMQGRKKQKRQRKLDKNTIKSEENPNHSRNEEKNL